MNNGESFGRTGNSTSSFEKAYRAATDYAILEKRLLNDIDAHIHFETSLNGRPGEVITADGMKEIVTDILASKEDVNALYLFPSIQEGVKELLALQEIINDKGALQEERAA